MSLEHTRFMWNNLVDAATLAASSAATGCPVTNIQHAWKTKVWRSTGDANEWVTLDLGSAQDVKSVVILNHNFSAGASVRIQADNDSDYSSLAVDVVMPVVSGCMAAWWASAQSYRYWRITIADAANTSGYVEIGRVFIGTYFAPTYDVSSWSFAPTDPSAMLTSVGGQLSANTKAHYSVRNYQFAYVPDADKTIWDSIFAAVGMASPIFVCEDVYDTGAMKYVHFSSALNFDFLFYQPNGDGFAYDLSFTLQEAR